METNAERYEKRIRVTDDHTDELGHVNHVVYVDWMQDIAIEHWTLRASEEDRKNLVWMVTRLEVDYKRQTFPGDEIIVRTWVGRASRRLFERYTEIVRAQDGKMLIQGKTTWCPIDPKTGRPTVVSADVRRKFSIGEMEEQEGVHRREEGESA